MSIHCWLYSHYCHYSKTHHNWFLSQSGVIISLFVTTIMQLLAGTWVKGQQGMVQSQPACILQWCSIWTTGKALCICAERRALCHAPRTAALTTASNQPQPYWHAPARWMPAEEQGLSFIAPVLAGSILVPFRWSVGICKREWTGWTSQV